MTATTTPDLTGLLQKHFGYASFRPLQEEIIRNVLSGNDGLVVMPTGSGKSMCFQIPALCLNGVTLVISPLISLMKDQVDGLNADGIPAAFLNSTQTAAEQTSVRHAAQEGKIKLLYIAPERLAVSGFNAFLSSINIRLIAVDEAHCISTWGHEFRSDYRNLKGLREAFPDVPCIALTATATPRVREDIQEQLNLKDARVFLSGFNRENLTYHVYQKHRALERVLLALRKPGRLPAIVYCFSRRDTEVLADDLRGEGFTALPYHAGLDQKIRRDAQDKFMRDEVQVITATIAFGMGIDKPDVRTVIHMDLPKNVEGYYQETGRAGRDGLQSDCILFYSYGDKFKQEFFIRQIEDPAQQKTAQQKLKQMIRYSELQTCRRAYLLSYFGEEGVPETCKGCDRCLTETESFDATEIAGKILSAVIKTGERFGTAHVCDVLRGKNTARIREVGHVSLSVYGIVKDWDDRQLRDIVASLVQEKYLAKAPGEYPTLSVTEKGYLFLARKEKVQLKKPDERMAVAEREKDDDELPFDAALFEELRALRLTLAQDQGVAAYVIFGDRSLREMATYFPQRSESFAQIYGVSDRKNAHYGEAFLNVIRAFAKERNLAEVPVPAGPGLTRRKRERAVRRKGSTHEETRALVLQKLPLKDIAGRRDLSEGTIAGHIEKLVGVEPALDIDYLRPPKEIFDEIAACFQIHGMEALAPSFQEFEGKYSYDMLRFVRMFLMREEKLSGSSL